MAWPASEAVVALMYRSLIAESTRIQPGWTSAPASRQNIAQLVVIPTLGLPCSLNTDLVNRLESSLVASRKRMSSLRCSPIDRRRRSQCTQ
jgi:hypothetical protein